MKRTKLVAFVLAVAVIISTISACGGATVTGIEVTQLPGKTEYAIGEAFSVDGGQITVTYSDGATSVVAMDSEEVSLSKVNTDKAGKKSITVTYGEERTRFDITVKPFVVSYDLGGKGTLEPTEIKEVGPIDNLPDDPVAENAQFDGWYYNAELSEPFDANAPVTGDMTLYAKWLDTSVVYHTVTFDLNYYGSGKATELNVEENTNTGKPADPQRAGYQFDGWFTAQADGEEFDFTTAIQENTCVYAHWTLVATGTNEYVFEAEDIDLTGKNGKGYSGEQEGVGLIQTEAVGSPTMASNNRFVGYTYVSGLVLDFHIVSDRDVDDAKIVARLSGEFADLTLTPDMFVITLNGEPLNYGSIEITDVPNGGVREFEDYNLVLKASLKEGENHLSFLVNNDVNWIGGGTVAATAPLLDCVKITTSAVLWWNGEFGLPMKNY